MNYIDLFKEQLDEAVPCDGDFLQGASFEDALKVMEDQAKTAFHPVTFDDAGMDEYIASLPARLTQKVQEWADHKGERMCFYIECGAESPSMRTVMEMHKIWENDIPALQETMTVVMDAKDPTKPLAGKYPRFLRKE